MHFSDEEGNYAVNLARDTIHATTKDEKLESRRLPKSFLDNYGVFTTINTFPSLQLRGCIGIPEPIMPLGKAIVRSAASAAKEDPRFPRLKPGELERVVTEVSLLTNPELVEVKKSSDYLKKIVVGRDGILLRSTFRSGLLLPQVPVEQRWNIKRYLSGICEKSGLKGNCWKNDDVKLYTFQAEIFHELSPGGDIKRKIIG
jgi:uncharacterized protein